MLDDASKDWFCEYQLLNFGSEKIRRSIGVDSVQAFLLALTYISTTLYFSEDYKKGNLTWLGRKDLGLPVADNVRAEVEKLIESSG